MSAGPPGVRHELCAAYGSYGCTVGLESGCALPECVVRRVTVEPIIAAYRRMIRGLEFDVCELAPMTFLMACSRGLPLRALPVFLMRDFHQGDLVCRTDAGIEHPRDLEGKKVGIRAYSVTTAVWMRGMLADQFGVDLRRIEWVVDDEDHVEGLSLPPNVTKLPVGQSIAAAFASGEIQAAVRGIAGIGRSGNPLGSWVEHQPANLGAGEFHALIARPLVAARQAFKRTQVYPVHRVVVINQTSHVSDAQVEALFDRFLAAKDDYVHRLGADRTLASPDDDRYRAFIRFVGDDPLPYGLAANRLTLDKLTELGRQQGLLPQGFDGPSFFYPLDPRGVDHKEMAHGINPGA